MLLKVWYFSKETALFETIKLKKIYINELFISIYMKEALYQRVIRFVVLRYLAKLTTTFIDPKWHMYPDSKLTTMN